MKPYTDTLREINGGKFAAELDEALQKLVLDVKNVNKAGSLSVTLKLKPTRGQAFEIEHAFNVKSPEFQRPADIMFVTADGALVRDNPTQGKLPLRQVELQTSGPVRQVVGGSAPPPTDAPHDPNTGEIKQVVPPAVAAA